MTLKDLLLMPAGMDIEEYQIKLKSINNAEKRLKTLSNKLYDEEGSLEVLADEIGSERYNRHLHNYNKIITEIDKVKKKIDKLNAELGRQ